MNKPIMKREVAIARVFVDQNAFNFYGTLDAAKEFEQFGEVGNIQGDLYYLRVDARFDFYEVLKYVEAYG